MNQCRPNDILPNETPVVVNGKKGHVASSRKTVDQHGAPITVHLIRFDDRAVSLTREVNYSFIYY